jgi:AcrR family transcriptional regulator
MAAKRPNPPVQARSQARVARILDAAEAELLVAGVDGLTMNAVAVRSATAAGSLYQFFPGKPALLMALTDRFDARIIATATALRDALLTRPPPDIAATALGFLDPFIDFYAANPAYLLLADAALRSPPPDGVEGLADTATATALAECLAPFVAETARARLAVATRLLVEVSHGAISLAAQTPGDHRDALLAETRMLVSAYVRTLAVGGPHSKLDRAGALRYGGHMDMTLHPTPETPAAPRPGRPVAREDRLKASLKANMARRKSQAKARAGESPSEETKDGT